MLTNNNSEVINTNTILEQEKEKILLELQELKEYIRNKEDEYNKLLEKKEGLNVVYNTVVSQKEEITHAYNILVGENEKLTKDYNTLVEKNEELNSSYNELTQEKKELTSTYNKVLKQKEKLVNEKEELKKEIKNLSNNNLEFINFKKISEQEKENLSNAYEEMVEEKENILLENNDLRKAYNAIASEKDELIKSYKDLEEVYQNKLTELEKRYNKVITEKDKTEKKVHSSSTINKYSTELKDNNVLLISRKDGMVYLPYNIQEIIDYKKYNKINLSIEEIIDEKYIIPIRYYKNKQKARYAETYDLMRNKSRESIANSIKTAYEISQNEKIHPAIITACKNKDELDTYIQCLQNNSKFKIFDIKYE